MMTPTRDDYLDPEIERTLEALGTCHPAFGAHERFVRDRLTQLAHRAYQHGKSMQLFGLHAAPVVAEMLGITRSYVTRIAKRNDIGWQVGRDRIYRSEDIEALRSIIGVPPGPKRGRGADDDS